MSVKNNIEQFSERLREVVGSKSARAFALECGMSPAGFHKYLTGSSVPSMLALIEMAKVAGVGVEWLATGEGPKRGWGELTESISVIVKELDEVNDKEDLNMESDAKAKLIIFLLDEILDGKYNIDDVGSRIDKIVTINMNRKGQL